MLDEIRLEDVQDLYPRYNIENHVYTGGQKAVYKGAEDGQDIVVKIIPMESRGKQKRAEREILAMERIDHPNMVDLLDYFPDEIDGNPALVLVEDYVEGNTLRDIIDGGGASISRGMSVVETLLDVLVEFDDENIVHRDIKPSNIIIRPDNETVLLDVGIARFLTETSLTPTFAPQGPGTVGYAAPEQMNNEKELQDARTDLFSVGIVLAESITGEHPFDIDGLDVSSAIVNDRKRSLDDMTDGQVDQSLSQFYDKLTMHEPYKRYRKPSFALEDLQAIKEAHNAL